MAAVRPFLDLRDLSTPAGELHVVADLEVSHLPMQIQYAL
jgi:hypothetical protein